MTTVREEIDSIKQHIAAAYGAVKGKGGAIPKDKNCANLAVAIGDISTGTESSGIPEYTMTVRSLRPANTMQA